MKKYLTLVLSMLLVLGFAAGALAIHAEIPSETQAVVAKGTTQITLGGEIRVRGWYEKNILSDSNDGIPYRETSTWPDYTIPGYTTYDYYDAWVSESDLGYDVNDDGDTDDHVYLSFADWPYVIPDMDVEAGSSTWRSKLYGSSRLPAKSKSHSWYDQRVRLWVDAQVSPNLQGYVMIESNSGRNDVYTWGSDNSKPTDLHILQAWILYKGSGLFGFPAGIKIGHMPLALGEKQFFDHTKFGDDAIVLFMDPTKQLHVALLTIKLSEGTSTDNTNDTDAYVALMTYKIDDKNTVGANYTNINNSDMKLKLSNLGLHANGNVAGLGYKAEVDFQFGRVSSDPKEKFKGYGVMAGLNYKVDPVNIRGSFALGSGDNKDDKSIKDFQTFLGNDQHYTLVYEYRVPSTAGRINSGLTNTTYYNLGVDYSPNKDLALSLDGYILRATKTYSGVSKNAGWEVDAKAVYKIAKNLTYQVDAGYFKPGKYYSDTYGWTYGWDDGDGWSYYENADYKRTGAVVLRHALTLSF